MAKFTREDALGHHWLKGGPGKVPIGPILLGMGVLQMGDDVNAIVQIASVAVMDAMNRDCKK